MPDGEVAYAPIKAKAERVALHYWLLVVFDNYSVHLNGNPGFPTLFLLFVLLDLHYFGGVQMDASTY
jgi:hypothetical protein